ncbi:MAG TPA: PAS domain S-box protein [Methanocella sp.]|nr:PAS domain S-box protein [Methanocella sp.]
MKERLLVVEDEAIVLLDIQSRLVQLGYTIAGTASTGKDAMELAARVQPDVILMDIGLRGDIDGIAAAESIRKNQDTPIIFLTANSDITTLHRSRVVGPFGYVLKPFDERELRVTIEMAIYKHRMDRDLNDARQWLTATLKSTGDGVITADEAGTIKFMNGVAETLTGWKLSDVSGKEVSSVLHIIKEDNIMSKNWDAPPDRDIVYLIDKDGRKTPIEYVAVPIKDDQDKKTGTVHVLSDVSDIFRIYGKLRDSQELLKEIMQSSPIPQFFIDNDHKIIYWNKALEELSGIKAESIIGTSDYSKAFYSTIRPCMADIMVDQQTELLDHWYPGQYKQSDLVEDSYETVHFITFGNSKGRWLSGKTSGIRNRDGNIIGAVETLEDVTGQKKAEEALVDAEKVIDILCASSSDAIFTCNLKGDFIYANRVAADLFGLMVDELAGKDLFNIGILHDVYLLKMTSLFGKLQGMEKPTSEEVVLIRKDGTSVTVDLSAQTIRIKGQPSVLIIMKRRLYE